MILLKSKFHRLTSLLETFQWLPTPLREKAAVSSGLRRDCRIRRLESKDGEFHSEQADSEGLVAGAVGSVQN